MTTVTVTGEYYTVATDVGSGAHQRGETREGRYSEIAAAVTAAMQRTLDLGTSCKVLRITTHEPTPGDAGSWFPAEQPRTETVTGEVSIPGPHSYDNDPALSRHHPVNGWVIPATIDVAS